VEGNVACRATHWRGMGERLGQDAHGDLASGPFKPVSRVDVARLHREQSRTSGDHRLASTSAEAGSRRRAARRRSGCRFGSAESRSGSAATRPAWATMQQRVDIAGQFQVLAIAGAPQASPRTTPVRRIGSRAPRRSPRLSGRDRGSCATRSRPASKRRRAAERSRCEGMRSGEPRVSLLSIRALGEFVSSTSVRRNSYRL
jgi:hypothetical protein